jgi:hypothetical protein
VFGQLRRGDTLTDRRLSDQSLALIVKRRAISGGLPPRPRPLGRCALCLPRPAAAAAGVEERKMANVARHKNITVLRGYIRAATAPTTTSARCCRRSLRHRYGRVRLRADASCL